MSSKSIRADTSIEALAALICGALAQHGIHAVLTGGAVVSIYTDNEFQSRDLDFISAAGRQELDRAMAPIGFARGAGRHYTHPATEFIVEFPSGPLMVGAERIERHAERRTPIGTIRLLTPTDAVKDRLAGFLHWSDRQNLEQALALCRAQPVKLADVERWAAGEGQEERFATFLARLRNQN